MSLLTGREVEQALPKKSPLPLGEVGPSGPGEVERREMQRGIYANFQDALSRGFAATSPKGELTDETRLFGQSVEHTTWRRMLSHSLPLEKNFLKFLAK